MRSLIASTAVVALLAVAPAMAQSTTSDKMNPGSAATPVAEQSGDTYFIDRAARVNEAQIELGKLAEQKAQNPEVQALARRLVNDHTKANQELKQIAQKEGISMPTGIDKDTKDLRVQLEQLNGAAFDRAFADAARKDHQKELKFYQDESSRLRNPQLKSFAEQNMPVLQEHVRMAEQAWSQVGASGGTAPAQPQK